LEALRLAKQAAPDAMKLLITMMGDEGEDPRARRVAANAILDRALGKPKDAPPPDEKASDAWGGMTADAMRQKIAGMMDSLASGRLTDAEAQAIMGAGGGVVVVLPDNGR
jgi:hypothetical protein